MSEDCYCICHTVRGEPGEGGTVIWDDDRGIRHEDWHDCNCDCARTDGEPDAAGKRASE